MPRRTLLRIFPFAIAGCLCASAGAFSPLIATAPVDAYRSALSDVHKGKKSQAAAVFDGLLLRRQVRIGVDLTGAPKNFESDYRDGIASSVAAWSDALGETPFVLVKDGEKPDLTVRFVKLIRKGGEIQGVINAQRKFFWSGKNSGYQLSGEIQIKNNAYGHGLDGGDVSRVMTHELGHLLGLADDYAGYGAMGAFRLGLGAVQPTDEEIEALQEFRGELRNASRLTK